MARRFVAIEPIVADGGPLAPIACACRTAYEACGDCKSVKACAVRFTMVRVPEAISDVLDRMTIADMVAVSEGGNVTPIVSGRSAAWAASGAGRPFVANERPSRGSSFSIKRLVRFRGG